MPWSEVMEGSYKFEDDSLEMLMMQNISASAFRTEYPVARDSVPRVEDGVLPSNPGLAWAPVILKRYVRVCMRACERTERV